MTGLEPIALPIVIKAVDFLFDQATKILDKQRTSSDAANKETDNQSSVSNKNDILKAITSINEAEIKHCLNQIEKYKHNVYLIENEIADWAGALNENTFY